MLQPIDSEQLASPLILKVLTCQNDAYLGLALILDGAGVEGKKLLLKSQEGRRNVWDEDVEARLTEDEAFTIANQRSASPIRIDATTDALRAFLNYL